MQPAAPETDLSHQAHQVGLLVDAMTQTLQAEAGQIGVLISITLDSVGHCEPAGKNTAQMKTDVQIDRRTRTLAFLSGTLSGDQGPVYMASAIFRLSAQYR